MSNTGGYDMGGYDGTQPHHTPDNYDGSQPPKKRGIGKKIALGVGGLALFLVGIGVGGASSSGTSAEPAEVITETVTETVTAEPEVITETETVEVEVVPQACLDALTSAEDGFTAAADLSYSVADMLGTTIIDALEAAFYQDIAGMEQATADMDAHTANIQSITARVEASTFQSDAAACRNAG